MSTPYVQDNTRSLAIVIATMVGACVLIALLLGLSDKPVVESVVVSSAPQGSGAAPSQIAADGDGSVDPDASIIDEVEETPEAAESDSVDFDDLTTDEVVPFDETEASESQAGIIAEPTAVPTATPEPEIAPAVETVAAEDDAADEPVADDTNAALATETAATGPAPGTSPSGTAVGNFFTRPDEENGATVRENMIEVSFDGQGGGTFTGVLDMTYADGATVAINMIGAFEWTSGSPQVSTDIAGSYSFDSTDDAKDVTIDRAELSITSLESGSGALCTPTCYGFTFPPQSIS